MTLVEIKKPDFDVDLYIAYATDDNFTNAPLYKNPYCFLHETAAKHLKTAIELASAVGLRIKIFDAFRPLEVQQALWKSNPNPEFISNPETGKTPHCRGIAADLTLIDKDGVELDMGTGFDAFTPLSHHGVIDGISSEALLNRHILMGIMTAAGWDFNPNEWWHYQLPNFEIYKKLTDESANTNML